jgi:hypothetical protein
MTWVREKVLLPDSDLANVNSKVIIQLDVIDGNARPVEIFDDGSDAVIVSPTRFELPVSGVWEENLPANDDGSPEDTIYRRIVEGPGFAYPRYFTSPVAQKLPLSVTASARTTNVVSLTVVSSTGYAAGERIVCAAFTGNGAVFNGNFTVKDVPDGTHVRFDQTGSDIAVGGTGTVGLVWRTDENPAVVNFSVPSAALTAHERDPEAHSGIILESAGAAIDQRAGLELERRFLTYIKDAWGAAGGKQTGHNYGGGDVTDCFITPPTGLKPMWIFADGLAGANVDDATEMYLSTPLPVRNGAIHENTPGSFTKAIQSYVSGNSGLWLDAVTQGGHPAGRIWWPIAIFDDNGAMRVICWHVESPAANGEPHGRLVDTDIVTINAFLGYDSDVNTGIGSLTDDFWACGVFRDAGLGFTYTYGMEFVPPFDDRTTANPTAPNYALAASLADLDSHYSLTRVARVVNGSYGTVASWEYWNGSAWVAGVVNAVPMLDSYGEQIKGDFGATKINTDHYLAVAHRLTDTHLDVYNSSVPQGPWTKISRVPMPFQGHNFGGSVQVGQLCKILPDPAKMSILKPPPGHRIALISRNLVRPDLGYGSVLPFTQLKTVQFAPQLIVIPES